ncbi:peptidoglycan DD-metalloendopeptidase family protein [Spongiivirga citrea]|uniref:Peptidoglycan DD-metalloendopeptidase family protein n=1 Tax=Spongiivirga citrea TaxID=1481457 RepID=A0A6M0CF18_9FLAO|nr:peptidoglycan DD-metalloendopeptidase family protein [Spongiivirga citrea]NER16022.1 peptidoglycan DD-metalloendopeptidase family protein [Spongiivirga citrea]
MNSTFEEFLSSLTTSTTPVIDPAIPFADYVPLDLTAQNAELKSVDLSDPYEMQEYLDRFLEIRNAKVAYGGYREKRLLYKNSPMFNTGNQRDIHLAMDFWITASTKVVAPIDGEVHSFADNSSLGDYGPTIILKHQFDEIVFYTLYGHLARTSLNDMYVGKQFRSGDVLANLGTPKENVNYAPHLHFQIIRDLNGKEGDFPGVFSEDGLEEHLVNCPDPNLLLKIY